MSSSAPVISCLSFDSAPGLRKGDLIATFRAPSPVHATRLIAAFRAGNGMPSPVPLGFQFRAVTVSGVSSFGRFAVAFDASLTSRLEVATHWDARPVLASVPMLQWTMNPQSGLDLDLVDMLPDIRCVALCASDNWPKDHYLAVSLYCSEGVAPALEARDLRPDEVEELRRLELLTRRSRG